LLPTYVAHETTCSAKGERRPTQYNYTTQPTPTIV